MEEYILEEAVKSEEVIVPEQPEPKKKNKRLLWVFLCAAVIVLAAAAILAVKPLRYVRAGGLFEQGEYLQAAQVYADIGDYKDSAGKEDEARYYYAGELMKAEDYTGALAVYQALGEYEDSSQRVLKCYYRLAEEALEKDDPALAVEYFEKATDDYRDSAQRRINTIYQTGHELFLDGEYDEAQSWFEKLPQWPEGTGPHFVTFDEALEYIQTQAETLPETVTVVVKDMPGSYILRSDILNANIQQRLGYQFSKVSYNEETRALTVIPSYYPGQKIVYAIRTGDFSKLTPEEQKVYEIALDLVEQARAADPDPEAMELWLHDWLCENVEYDSPYEYVYPEDFVGLDELTCVGALRDGKANCQGYTDAFYLLGTMAGLKVYVIFGYAEDGGHCWNGVFLDGKTYTVDVTFNDSFCQEPDQWTYIWYNNVLDLDEYNVLGGSTLFPNMVTRKDLSKTYYTRAEVVYEGINYAAFGLLREYRKNGAGVYHAVIEDQERTQEELRQALINNMGLAGVYSARYSAGLYTYEGDTYICLEWISK